jgi:hypothetical protein
MRTTLARLATTGIVILIVAGCGPTTTTSPSPTGSALSTGSTAPSSASSRSASPEPPIAAAPGATYMAIETSLFPMRGSARELGIQIQIAPGPDGTLLVTIPTVGGSTFTILDKGGKPREGWPIFVVGATPCGQLFPISDGSVRVVCTLIKPDGEILSPTGVFAFDTSGRLLPGWPMALDGSTLAARMIGDELTMFAGWPLPDNNDGKPTEERGLVTIGYTGEVRNGTRVPMFCCENLAAIGPDGVAAAVTNTSGEGSQLTSEITAMDHSGVIAGWPRLVDGIAATPAFVSDGRVLVAAGLPTQTTSDAYAFTRDGQVNASSPISMAMVDESWHDTGGCGSSPQQPLVARDGRVVVFSEADTTIAAFEPSLNPDFRWPYRPARPLVRRDERYVKEDAYCPLIAIPAVGPDGSVFLPIQARMATVGGSLVAVNPDARVRPGWPVELKRAGSEFWSVVVGPEGTAFALAIEPESSRTSSASILAIAPDGTVRYTTTIINP